mmetsp:Transcript_43256/g.50768  ORF Transcript_43256/g.50768 Transcript_43256/m.50768 type:complete len:338 (+) Transcript_43256:297-1310(+)
MIDVVIKNDTVIWIHGQMTSVKTSSYIGRFDSAGNHLSSYAVGSEYFFNNWISHGFMPLSETSFEYTYSADPTENRQNISSTTGYDFAIALSELDITKSTKAILYNVVIDVDKAADYPWKIAADANGNAFMIGSSGSNIVLVGFATSTLSSNIKSGIMPAVTKNTFSLGMASNLNRNKFSIDVAQNKLKDGTEDFGFGAYINSQNDPIVFKFNTTNMVISSSGWVNTTYKSQQMHNYLSVSLVVSSTKVVFIGQADSSFSEGDRDGFVALLLIDVGSATPLVVTKYKEISIIPRIGKAGINDILIGGNSLNFEKKNSTKTQSIVFKSNNILEFKPFS